MGKKIEFNNKKYRDRKSKIIKTLMECKSNRAIYSVLNTLKGEMRLEIEEELHSKGKI